MTAWIVFLVLVLAVAADIYWTSDHRIARTFKRDSIDREARRRNDQGN